jgi:hypothetical protein
MPKYVIERSLPGVGQLSAQDRREIAANSCRVLRELGACAAEAIEARA